MGFLAGIGERMLNRDPVRRHHRPAVELDRKARSALNGGTRAADAAVGSFETGDFGSGTVILLDPGHPLASEVQARVMAMGFEVLFGPDAPDIDETSLVLVPQDSLGRANVATQLARVARYFPAAPVFCVSGVDTCAPRARDYSDMPDSAQALLAASGIQVRPMAEMRPV